MLVLCEYDNTGRGQLYLDLIEDLWMIARILLRSRKRFKAPGLPRERLNLGFRTLFRIDGIVNFREVRMAKI